MPITAIRPPEEKKVITLSTAADLAAMLNPDEPYGRVVQLLGWDTAYDGLGGSFAFDQSDTTSPTRKPDVILPTGYGYSALGRWKRTDGPQVRDAAITYADGVLVHDSTGVYRGDGATPGGVLLSTASFSVASTEEFARSGEAIEFFEGAVVADGAKVERTLRWPEFRASSATMVELPGDSTKSLLCVTRAGTWLSTDTTSPGNARLHRSTDQGATWTTFTWTAGGGTTVKSIIALAGPTKEILVAFVSAGNEELRLSVDDGATWTANLFSASSVLIDVTGDFSSAAQIEAPTGRAAAENKILITAYGGRVCNVSLARSAYGANRVLRSQSTLADIEADPSSTTWEILWKVDVPDYYASFGLGRYPAQEQITDGVVGAATADTLTETGKFAALSLANSHIKLLTGAGAGQVRIIESHTDDVLTLADAWATAPSAGDSYAVVAPPADAAGMHLHAARYVAADSGGEECLWLSFGDGNSNGLLRIPDPSQLTGIPIASDVRGQPVNWSGTELIHTGTQPTTLIYTDENRLLFLGTDDLAGWCGYMDDASPYTIRQSLWDFMASSRAAYDINYTWDGTRGPNGLCISSVFPYSGSGGIGGIFFGDPIEVGGMHRIWRDTDANRLSAYMVSASSDAARIRLGKLAARMPDAVTSVQSVFLGDAVTNLFTNSEYDSTDGITPDGWVGSYGGATSLVAGAPSYGGGNYWEVTWLEGQAPQWYQAVASIAEGDVVDFSVATCGETLSRTTLALWWYSAVPALISTDVSEIGYATLATSQDWATRHLRATAPAGTASVRAYIRVTGSSPAGRIQTAAPMLAKNVERSVACHGTRSAETYRHTVAASAYTPGRGVQVEAYLRPFRSSLTARTATEDIVSIESHDAYRVLLQYVDDGAGSQSFLVVTYDGSGTEIATSTLGMIPHSIQDLFRVRLTWTNGLLRAEIATPSESISASQVWIRPWRPTTIAYGENQWSAGSRYVGWYSHAAVRQ